MSYITKQTIEYSDGTEMVYDYNLVTTPTEDPMEEDVIAEEAVEVAPEAPTEAVEAPVEEEVVPVEEESETV